MTRLGFVLLGCSLATATASAAFAQSSPPASAPASASGPAQAVIRHITQGRAKTVTDNLYTCPEKVSNYRLSAVGTITAADGTVLTAPATTAYQEGQRAGGDLLNECTKVTPKTASEISAAALRSCQCNDSIKAHFDVVLKGVYPETD